MAVGEGGEGMGSVEEVVAACEQQRQCMRNMALELARLELDHQGHAAVRGSAEKGFLAGGGEEFG